MSSKRVWEIWCPGRKVMERIALEVPNIAARFKFNDFCAIYPTEPEIYNIEMINEENKWVKSERIRWNIIGKQLHFPVKNSDFAFNKQAQIDSIHNMIEFLKKNPRP